MDTSNERIEVTKDGSLIIEDVDVDDSGQYTMEINGVEALQFNVVIPGIEKIK